MRKIMHGAPGKCKRVPIDMASWTGRHRGRDPFSGRFISQPEHVTVYWGPDKNFNTKSHDIYDTRLNSLYKSLVDNYDVIPQLDHEKGRFVELFNLLRQGWIAIESETPVETSGIYTDILKIISDLDTESESKDQKLIEGEVFRSRPKKFRIFPGIMGFEYNFHKYSADPNVPAIRLKESQYLFVKTLYNSKYHRISGGDLLNVLRTELKRPKLRDGRQIWEVGEQGAMDLYKTLVRSKGNDWYLDI